jgi:hypothetical protein
LTGAALELGENEICKGFAFSRVGRVERVECLDVALVDFLKIPASKSGQKKKTDRRRSHKFAFFIAREAMKLFFLTLVVVFVVVQLL